MAFPPPETTAAGRPVRTGSGSFIASDPSLRVEHTGFAIFTPPPPTWGLRFSADRSVCFAMHKPPALFHRLMQRLLLGIRYDRINLRQ